MNDDSQRSETRSRVWKYFLWIVVAAFVITVALMLIDGSILTPDETTKVEAPMKKLWWIGVPALAIALLIGVRWITNFVQARERQAQAQSLAEQSEREMDNARTEKGRREYVLEVIGLGVTFEKYRQGKLWDALRAGAAHTTIREQDPRKYPWAGDEKDGMSGSRSGDTLENGAWDSVDSWGVPVFNAQPPIHDKNSHDSPLSPFMGLTAGAESSGMLEHLFVAGPRRFDERPDRILDDVFKFFDTNPDIPYVVLNSNDDMTLRDMFAEKKKGAFENDGYYIPAMPDSSTLFLLARRERVDTVRPFAFEDVEFENNNVEVLNRESIARRLFLTYLDLENTVPMPDDTGRLIHQRSLTIAEWLPAAAKFGVRPDIRGTGPISVINRELHMAHRPPLDWKPTPWFPVPWSKRQLAEFDNLPTFGFIHRPVFVNMSDEHGKPLATRALRKQALMAGWQEALLTLHETERAKGPARIIAATNNNIEQTLALEGLLTDYAAQGGPEIDSSKMEHFINTDKRLGNTGAATLFMQMAIGVMGSYRAGGPSAAINLRDPREASIVFITPPSDAKRKAQDEARGDVFRPRNSPAINPANYAPPVRATGTQ
ncbi:MAG: DUF2875 family protein [Pseudomonadota bacterium]